MVYPLVAPFILAIRFFVEDVSGEAPVSAIPRGGAQGWGKGAKITFWSVIGRH